MIIGRSDWLFYILHTYHLCIPKMKITYACMPILFERRSHFLVGSRPLLVVARRLSPVVRGNSPSRRIFSEPIEPHTFSSFCQRACRVLRREDEKIASTHSPSAKHNPLIEICMSVNNVVVCCAWLLIVCASRCPPTPQLSPEIRYALISKLAAVSPCAL